MCNVQPSKERKMLRRKYILVNKRNTVLVLVNFLCVHQEEFKRKETEEVKSKKFDMENLLTCGYMDVM